MKAIRNNKEYTITDAEKSFYIAQGYDIVEDDGKVIKYGAGKTVPYEEYKELEKKYEELKKKLEASEDKEEEAPKKVTKK